MPKKYTDDSTQTKPNKTTVDKSSLKVYEGRECCRKSSTVRSVWYLLSYVLLLMATPLIWICLFTNNWLRTASYLIPEEGYFYTQGIFYVCRHIKANWLGQNDVYCYSANNSTNGWLVAVQVFYTFGAVLNLFSLILATYGLFKDLSTKKHAVPSFLMWFLLSSCLCQVIAISLYGHRGLGDYSLFEADYSIITASVTVFVNFFCGIMFMADIYSNRSQQETATDAF